MQDVHTVDLDQFKYTGTNITALRLVNPQSPEALSVSSDWASEISSSGRARMSLDSSHGMRHSNVGGNQTIIYLTA